MLTMRRIPILLGWAFLLILPFITTLINEPFYVTLATRLMIFALAASSLNLVLGYGGMISFGHAAFFGAGGYVVGIMAASGIHSAWISWTAAILFAGLLALAIGALSLRTKGVYFIMITLAFAQMLFFLFTSLRAYGGQDGLSMDRQVIGFGLELTNNTTFYYCVLLLLVVSLYLLHRIIHSRFGHVLQAIKVNETRMMAIGYPVYRYKLVGFVIGGAIAGLAGALNANLNTFVSPNALAWSLSGQMMMMVILGGVGRFWGGMVGAFSFLLLETWMEDLIQWLGVGASRIQFDLFGNEITLSGQFGWQLPVGIVLLVIVLIAPQGITGLIAGIWEKPSTPESAHFLKPEN
jgi:branched-chain amino acid transport system permease protein